MASGTRAIVLTLAVLTAALTAAAALAAPGDPKLDLKPADQKRAKAILVKAAELTGKGWTGSPADFGRANPSCVIKHYSLAKLTANARAGIEYTRSVDTGTFLVDSDVYVFKTPGQATTAAATASDLGYGRCLAAALRAETPNGSLASSKVKAYSIPGLALPTQGFVITVNVIAGKSKTTLTAHVINAHKGRSLSQLSVLTADKGWSSDTLRALAAKVAARTAKS